MAPELTSVLVSPPTCLSAAPVIVTPPGEVFNVSGSQVYLSCEAVGVPTPVLTWKKVSNLNRGICETSSQILQRNRSENLKSKSERLLYELRLPAAAELLQVSCFLQLEQQI